MSYFFAQRSQKVCAAVLASALAMSALMPTTFAFAADAAYEKEQVIYVKTDGAGTQEGVYVVNTFTNGAEGAETAKVEDGGTYETVTNLSDLQKLSAGGDVVTFEVAPGQVFRYQGDLSAEVSTPWNVSLSYQLDGAPVEAQDLGGVSGELTMTIKVVPNEACKGEYADNYLLQVTGSLDNALARGIKAEGATVAQSGDDTQLTYLVFPGDTVEYTVKATVTDFAFAGWQLVGLPLSIALSVEEEQLEGAVEDLSSLSDAIARVNAGVNEIEYGSAQVESGLRTLANSSAPLTEGAASFASALATVSNGVNSLKSSVSGKLVSGAESLASGSSSFADGLASQAANYAGQANSYDTSSAYSTLVYDTEASSSEREAALQTIISAYSADGASDALYAALDNYGRVDSGAQSLLSSVYAIEDAASDIDYAMDDLTGGFRSLQDGISSYTSGVATLDESFGEYARGVATLASGSARLASESENLDTQLVEGMRGELEEYLNPDFEAPDFVNGSTDTGYVQFVYMTEGISADADDADVPEAPVEEKTGIMGIIAKFLALFGIEI